MIKIIFSGVIKPPPVIKLQLQPKSKKDIITCIYNYFKKFNIKISSESDDYFLFYYTNDAKQEISSQDENEKIVNIKSFKLKLIKWKDYSKKKELVQQISYLEFQQQQSYEYKFNNLMRDYTKKIIEQQDIQIPFQTTEQKDKLQQLQNEEKIKYSELNSIKKELKTLNKKFQVQETSQLEQQIKILNQQIEDKVRKLDQLQDYCLFIIQNMLTKSGTHDSSDDDSSDDDILENQIPSQQNQSSKIKDKTIIPQQEELLSGIQSPKNIQEKLKTSEDQYQFEQNQESSRNKTDIQQEIYYNKKPKSQKNNQVQNGQKCQSSQSTRKIPKKIILGGYSTVIDLEPIQEKKKIQVTNQKQKIPFIHPSRYLKLK